MSDTSGKQKSANIRLAIILGLVALGFYLGFMYLTATSGS